MVYELTTLTRGFTANIRELLTKRFGNYPKLLEKGLPPRDADWSLCEKGVLTETDLLNIYCKGMQVVPLDEDELAIPERFPDVMVEYLNANGCIPYRWDDDNLELLIYDPYRLDHHEYVLGKFFQRKIHFLFTRRSLIERLVNQVYLREDDPDKNSLLSLEGDENTLRSLASEAKVVRLVNEMLTQAVEQEASDIHVEPEETQVVIRFRVDGILREYLCCPLTEYPAIASRIKLIGGLNIAESRLPQDGRTNFHAGRYDMDIRISTIPVMNGESIVMRILRKDAMSFDLTVLGMSKETLEKFEDLITIPHGIILVVGPTGSGKTTTLYSVMTQLNNRSRKIITIEDPVEYKLQGLNQMQVNPKIGLNFASGLRHIVRQDPDVILVGEIRDRETADIAINAALTGHLVLSTLHTNDAAGAITRLLDMGVEDFLISSALFGVLSQRLVRKLCKDCKGSGINMQMTGNKCKSCGSTGYRGRSGIYELLVVDDDIRRAIVENKTSVEIANIAKKNGMTTLIEDGRAKVASGVTNAAEVKRSVADI